MPSNRQTSSKKSPNVPTSKPTSNATKPTSHVTQGQLGLFGQMASTAAGVAIGSSVVRCETCTENL